MNNLPACFQEQKLKEQRTLNLRCWTRWLLIQNGKMHGWLLLDEAEMDVGCLDCLCEMTLHRCAELSPWQHSVFHLRYWQSWGLGNCINSWQPRTSRHLGYLNSLGLLEDYNPLVWVWGGALLWVLAQDEVQSFRRGLKVLADCCLDHRLKVEWLGPVFLALVGLPFSVVHPFSLPSVMDE